MAILSYPGTPGTALYGGRPKPAPPQPGEGVATTVAVANLSGGALTSAPTTFGFAFPPGAWQPDAHDIHAAVAGTPLTIQTDATALHPDGSVRFAVVTLDAGAMSAGQTKTIDLTTGGKRLGYVPALTAPAVNLVAEATIYGVQRTEIFCGAYPAPEFAVGEAVAVRLSTGATNYDYSITVQAGETGGTAVATALAAAINAGGIFRARREGEGGGYTRMTIELMNPLAGSFTLSTTYAGPSAVTFNTISAFAAPVLWSAAMQTELESQVASSNAGTIAQHKRRLHGPVVSEFRQTVKFRNPSNVEHPFLTAIFDTRLYADGRQWVDVALENTGLMTASPLAINYKLDIRVGGNVVHSEPRFWHFAKTRWHKSVWLGGNPQLRVTRDMAYFMTTRATPHYRLDLLPTSGQLDQKVASEATKKASQSWYGPMGLSLLTAGMGTTGDRPDIGIVSEWAIDYWVSQDDRAKSLMLKAVDDASAFDIHFRDEDTGWPIALDNRPTLETFRLTANVPLSTEMVPMGADMAHQGTFGYHPYLATGDAYYLDEMMFWASWNLTAGNAFYRFAAGYGNLLDNQTRGLAWSTRALAEVCYSLPSWHPRLAYYRDQMNAHLTHLNAVKGVSWANGPFNAILLGSDFADNWHCDFVTTVLGWMTEAGETQTLDILNHLAEYQFGRVLHGADGQCPEWAVDYFPRVKLPASGLNGTTWNEVAQANGSTQGTLYPDGVARYGLACQWKAGADVSYMNVLRAASAICADAGVVLAAPAHALWKTITPGLDTAPYRKWAIVRRT